MTTFASVHHSVKDRIFFGLGRSYGLPFYRKIAFFAQILYNMTQAGIPIGS